MSEIALTNAYTPFNWEYVVLNAVCKPFGLSAHRATIATATSEWKMKNLSNYASA